MEVNKSIGNENLAQAERLSPVKKIAVSGIVMALYISVMFYTQSFAFGQFQIRIATSLYALSAAYPFLIIPLGISNLLSNTLMGGLGIFDMIGGAAIGIVTSTLTYLVGRFGLDDWFILLPIIFGPGLIVPLWLSYLINVPYKILAVSLCIGQIIPAILGVTLIKIVKARIK